MPTRFAAFRFEPEPAPAPDSEPEVRMMPASDANPNHRKRNIFLATALTLIAMSFLFAPGEGGMLWMMWRDAPWLAVPLMLLAVVFLVLWRRASRG